MGKMAGMSLGAQQKVVSPAGRGPSEHAKRLLPNPLHLLQRLRLHLAASWPRCSTACLAMLSPVHSPRQLHAARRQSIDQALTSLLSQELNSFQGFRALPACSQCALRRGAVQVGDKTAQAADGEFTMHADAASVLLTCGGARRDRTPSTPSAALQIGCHTLISRHHPANWPAGPSKQRSRCLTCAWLLADRPRPDAAADPGSPCRWCGHPQPEADRVLAAVHLWRRAYHRQGHPC